MKSTPVSTLPSQRRNEAAAARRSDVAADKRQAQRTSGDARRGWRTLGWGLLGSLLMAASLPPLGLAPLAWVAPVPWLLLIRQRELPGKRPYWGIYAAGVVYWLLVLHWLRLPHPATSLGWLALSLLFGGYVAGFVFCTRVMVQRWGWSLLLAAPLAWIGFELLRAYLFTGLAIAQLAHTQYQWVALIQVADLTGGYLLSGLIMLVAAAIARCLPWDGQPRAFWPLVPAVVCVLAALGYGQWRLGQAELRPGPTVALIQGSIDTEMKADGDKKARVHREYLELSRQAMAEAGDRIDLVVWPETMFRTPLLLHDEASQPPPGVEWDLEDLQYAAEIYREELTQMVGLIGAPRALLGVDVHDHSGGTLRQYNSALLLDPQGELVDRYDKVWPVMFGEYIPLGSIFPWLYHFTPLHSGLQEGAGPVSMEVAGSRVSASICFESIQPQLIRQQIRTLAAAGEEPELLINLTNDGWFWGSSELDLHLMCAVFRAVESRKPMLVAANTGFSAWIDSDGRIRAQGPRRATGTIIADVELDSRSSGYLLWGDWPAALCLAVTLAAGVSAIPRRRFRNEQAEDGA